MGIGKSPAAPPGPRDAAREQRHLGPEALKAYAHPLRLAILRYLHDHDVATATTLAAHLGESTGQTSYHLRQLARHGIVEEVPGLGTGRERWWQQVSVTIDATTMREDPATAAAADAVLDATLAERHETLGAWLRRVLHHDDEPWSGAALHSQSTLVLTTDELTELNEELLGVLDRTLDRVRDRRLGERPADSARVRVYLDSFPLLEPDPPTD